MYRNLACLAFIIAENSVFIHTDSQTDRHYAIHSATDPDNFCPASFLGLAYYIFAENWYILFDNFEIVKEYTNNT